jgi:hypothetical protein
MFVGLVESTKTGADGTYKLFRVAPGLSNVLLLGSVEPMKPAASAKPHTKSASKTMRLAQALEGVQVTARTNTAAPTMTLVPPAFVEGTVVDAQSGAPLKGMRIGAYGPQSPRSSGMTWTTASQDNGSFHLPVLPGVNRVLAYEQDFMGGNDDKADAANGQHLTLKAGETRKVTLCTLRSPVLRGVAVDESGKPVAGTEMMVGSSRGSGRYIYMRSDGTFEAKGLSAGDVYLSTGGDFSDRDWRIIGEATSNQPGPDRGSVKVSLPQKEPLKITLQRLQYVSASGRVVTPTGKPVAGAAVCVKITSRADDKWSSYTYRKVTTDAQGQFTVGRLLPENVVSATAESQGFRLRGGGEGTFKDAAFRTTDLVMEPLGNKVSGVVVGAGGQPVAGARVLSASQGNEDVATTDAEGRFLLEAQPEGEVALLAALERRAGTTRATSTRDAGAAGNTERVVIELKDAPPLPPHDVARARSILQEAAPRLGKDDLLITMGRLVPFDPQAALQLAQVEPHAATIGADETRELIITSLARAGTQHTDWAIAQLDAITDNNRSVAATVALGLALAPGDPQKATELLQRAQARVDARQTSADAMRAQAKLAALALRLQLPPANRMLDAAIVTAERKPENGGLMALVPHIAR